MANIHQEVSTMVLTVTIKNMAEGRPQGLYLIDWYLKKRETKKMM